MDYVSHVVLFDMLKLVLLFALLHFFRAHEEDVEDYALTESPDDETMDQLNQRMQIIHEKISKRSDLTSPEKSGLLKKLEEEGTTMTRKKLMKSVDSLQSLVGGFISTLSVGDVLNAWSSFSWKKVNEFAKKQVSDLQREKAVNKETNEQATDL